MTRAPGDLAPIGHRLSIDAYDAIGFDLDHTLVRYNVPALMECVYSALVRFLVVERGYSAALLDVPFNLAFCVKSVAVDLHTGDTLKLAASGRVLQAFHGTRALDDAETRRKYPTTWRFFDDLRAHKKGSDFAYFITYFDIPAAWVLANAVDLVDAAGEGKSASADADHPSVRAHGCWREPLRLRHPPLSLLVGALPLARRSERATRPCCMT